jgi:hypothetical protein
MFSLHVLPLDLHDIPLDLPKKFQNPKVQKLSPLEKPEFRNNLCVMGYYLLAVKCISPISAQLVGLVTSLFASGRRILYLMIIIGQLARQISL